MDANHSALMDKIVEKLGKTFKKKQNTQKDLHDVNVGKKSARTLFKGQKDAGTMNVKIENVS